MKTLITVVTSLIVMLAASSTSAEVFYQDDFTGSDGAFNRASTPKINLLGASYALESYGVQQTISTDRLVLAYNHSTTASGGIRFGAADGRFNWASGSIGNAILNYGLQISFDLQMGANNDYISFGFGTDGDDPDTTYGTIYAATGTDWGLRIENDRLITFEGGTTTPRYRTDQGDGTAYDIGEYTHIQVDLFLDFVDGNFNTGSNVIFSAVLTPDGGSPIYQTNFDTWQLDGTGDFIWDIGAEDHAVVYVDDFVIQTIQVSSIHIISRPNDIIVADGQSASFTVTAEDLLGGTLSYQWYDEAGMLQNGDYDERISGADTASLTIADVTDDDEGSFYCELTNASMALLTDSVVLTVVPYFCDVNFPSHLDIAGGPDGTGDCIIDLLDLAQFFSEWLSS